MSDDPFTPDVVLETSSPKRFPVVRQLVFLGSLLVGLFILASGSPAALYERLMNFKTAPVEVVTVASNDVTELQAAGPHTVSEEVRVSAEAAFVWDVVGQKMLYSKSPDEILPLASITKLMTTLVAYEMVTGDMRATIPATATTLQSASGLRSGEEFTVHKLTELALVSSSNDAAYSLANSVGALLGEGDETAQFVEAMNIRADELGLDTLHFENTTGLDQTTTEAGAYGSAREITKLMAYILENYPELLSVTRQQSIRVANRDGEYHEAENTNPLVGTIPNLLGSKTGYTDLAGGNLVVAFDAGFNRPVIVTVLGSSHQGRFDDVERLVKAVLETPSE